MWTWRQRRSRAPRFAVQDFVVARGPPLSSGSLRGEPAHPPDGLWLALAAAHGSFIEQAVAPVGGLQTWSD
eukprot:7734975-Lingulodinium_polyedra.AAC.1